MSLSFSGDNLHVAIEVDKIDREYISLKAIYIRRRNDSFESEPDTNLCIPLVNLEGTSTFSLLGFADPMEYSRDRYSLRGGQYDSESSSETNPYAEEDIPIDPRDFDVHAKLSDDLSSIEFTVSLRLVNCTRSVTGTFKVPQESLVK